MKTNRWLGAGALLVVMSGCTATESNESSENASSDVVGLDDLVTLEDELGLVKDQNGATGWTRGDDVLTSGPCYRRSLQVDDAFKWQVRRYKNGAAFFWPKADALGMGDQRAVLCVDYDMQAGHGAGAVQTLELDDFVLDAVVRYHLGHPLGFDSAMMHVALSFERGQMIGQGVEAWCGTRNLSDGEGPPGSPPEVAGAQAMSDCHRAGLPESTCQQNAYRACVDEAKIDVRQQSWLSRPHAAGNYMSELSVDGAQFNAAAAAIAARYAAKKATSADIFNMKQDPVGTFAGIEPGVGPSQGWTHLRYTRLDVHSSYVREAPGMSTGLTTVVITPKSSDRDVLGSALVTCKRYDLQADFDCEGEGEPLDWAAP